MHTLVSGDDIVNWASRIEAASDLPLLVRRLLAATADLERLEFRADGGVRLSGIDGYTEARSPTEFCPLGSTVWELSTRNDRAKVISDFDKRTATQPQLSGPRPAYVAISARRLPNRENIEKTLRLKSVKWSTVHVHDADTLATWLSTAPTVAVWFAAHLGRPVDAIEGLEEFTSTWSGRTDPSLPSSLATVGEARDSHRRDLHVWFSDEAQRYVRVAGESNEESALFCCSALLQSPRREEFASRTVVVRTRTGLQWLRSFRPRQSMVAIVLAPDVGPGDATPGVRLILPGARGGAAGAPGNLVLAPLPHKALAQALGLAGFPPDKAAELARRADGSLATLQRLCGHSEPPEWAHKELGQPLMAALLAGSWDPSNAADLSFFRELGVEPEEVEELCTRLALRADSPVTLKYESWGPKTWIWRSPVDAWRQLAAHLNEHLLERFVRASIEVISEDDPRYGLNKGDRPYASLHGETPRHSEAIRKGIAESVVLLALSEDELARVYRPGTATAFAARIVRGALREDWRVWASAHSVLPLLAEASPETFLECLERSLAERDGGVSHLLAEESSWGSSPHTGVLWALELLAWNRGCVSRVVNALARLHQRDPGGNLVNRPLRTLRTVLHPLAPASATDLDARLSLLQILFGGDQESVAWEAGLASVKAIDGVVISSGYRPRYRHDWNVPTFPATVEVQDARRQVQATLDMLLAAASSTASRWVQLVCSTHGEARTQVLRKLRTLDDAVPDPDLVLWSALRELIARAYLVSSPVETINELITLYSERTPAALIPSVVWLFAYHVELPEPSEGAQRWEEKGRRVIELRKDAIRRILNDKSAWDSVATLVQRASAPELVGETLALVVGEDAEDVLMDASRPILASAAPGYIQRRFLDHEDWAWLRTATRRLVDLDRTDLAVRALLRLRPRSEIWTLVDSLGTDAVEHYWRELEGVYQADRDEDWQRATDEFVLRKRFGKAIVCADCAGAAVTAEQVLHILKSARSDDGDLTVSGGSSMLAHYVGRLFARLDELPLEAQEDVLALEVYFMPLLERERTPSRLFAALEARPALFVELITLIYRAERGEPANGGGDTSPLDEQEELPDPSSEGAARASIASRILNEWSTYPGHGAQVDERDRRLDAWAREALSLAAALKRDKPTLTCIAEVFARVPASKDGIWPCTPARAFLEKDLHPDFSLHLQIAKRNLRGMVIKNFAEGGQQERVLAKSIREAEEKLRLSHPRTAAMLGQLAREYEDDAGLADANAGYERRRSGDDVVVPRSFDSRAEYERALSDSHDELFTADLVIEWPGRYAGEIATWPSTTPGSRIAMTWEEGAVRKVAWAWSSTLAVGRFRLPDGARATLLSGGAADEVRALAISLGYTGGAQQSQPVVGRDPPPKSSSAKKKRAKKATSVGVGTGAVRASGRDKPAHGEGLRETGAKKRAAAPNKSARKKTAAKKHAAPKKGARTKTAAKTDAAPKRGARKTTAAKKVAVPKKATHRPVARRK